MHSNNRYMLVIVPYMLVIMLVIINIRIIFLSQRVKWQNSKTFAMEFTYRSREQEGDLVRGGEGEGGRWQAISRSLVQIIHDKFFCIAEMRV